MGILDDIQQMQMNQVQQGAQQQGFTDGAPPSPQVPDQQVSQIGQPPQQPQPTPDQPGSGAPGDLQKAMSDYAGWLLQKAQGLQQFSGGAGSRFKQGVAAAAAHQAGIPSQYESQIQNFGAQDQALKTAVGVQQTGLQSQMVTLPNGLTVPLALAKTLAPAMFRADTSRANNQDNNATKRIVAGFNPDGSVRPLSGLSVPQQVKVAAAGALKRLNDARADAANLDPNTPAGQGAIAKLGFLEQQARAKLISAGASAGMENIAAQKFAKDYIDGMQDEDGNPIGVQQYKAANGVDKAPAAMLQQAEYAKGGLQQFQDARGAINQLRAHGVLSGVPANKMEEMLFGNGLIDPTLSPEDQKLVGQARAGLGLGATAALRAHTGRGSREIYQDFVKRFGIGQGNQALDAALDQGEKLLTGYAAAGSNKAIHALRHPGGTSATSGVITLTDGGKSYKIPAALKASFLKDHPNAR